MKKLRDASICLICLFEAFNSYAQTYPPFTVTVFDTSSSGFYFTCPVRVGPNPNGIQPTHMILDREGRVVYFRSFPTGQNTGDFKLHDNGLMSYSRQGKYFMMDSTFNIVDSVSCKNGVNSDTHDMQILPNGNFLLLGFDNIQMDLSSYPLFGVNNVPGSATATVLSGVIQEQDPGKNVVFEWHASDHFIFDEVDEAWLTNPNLVDWTHCNAVEFDVDGNLLLSSRHFNEITKINRQNGAVMWRLGGNANEFTFLNDTMQFKRQHDIRRIANGNITLFDNGAQAATGIPVHYAAAKEYVVDEIVKTVALQWTYADDLTEFSRAMGNFQRRPLGNSLINYGQNATQNKFFQVLSESLQMVFEIAFDDSLCAYRSYNYPVLPWQLPRPEITCYESSGQYYLDAGPGHASYLWSDGSTLQTIPLAAAGSYHVFVPIGQGGFISSESFEVYNMSDPCGLTGIPDQQSEVFTAGPSPFTDELTIQWKGGGSNNNLIQIFNASGQIVYSESSPGSDNFTLSGDLFAGGVYWVRSGNRVVKVVKL